MNRHQGRELLYSLTKKDFVVQTFRSGGKGGQHQNKTDSGVRIIHKESGARGESRSERSQHTNKRLAFERLIKSEKFQKWHRIECARRMGSIEIKVNEAMDPRNLRIETFDPVETSFDQPDTANDQ